MVDLKLLQKRDPATLTIAFREINPSLLKVLAANGIRGENAEDLVHQTWERFFTNLEKFEARSSLQTFVTGILINQIREHRRAQKKTVVEEDAQKIYDQAFSPQGWWKIDVPEPSAGLQRRETSALIDDCLEGLSADQRSAFVLKEVDEKKSDEICNILGVTASNLRVLIYRAKDKLRQCLEGQV